MNENIQSMTQGEISQLLKALGQPAFRSKQVYTWLHKGVRSYGEMTNLPKALRDVLEEKYPLHIPKVVRKQESAKDGTIKYLWELSDGNCVETVLMRYHYGNSVCISTEVGCRMAAPFAHLLWEAWFDRWSPMKCSTKCSSPRWIPDCPFPILC